ncbi:MAG TPA: cyclopropane-fatty-acyl-phospholipid synthase family protein [Arenimonas sp.]|nr:cyclopropane-fatty-acyl-phospholipid synthase family protein [Arenimonas sp.]
MSLIDLCENGLVPDVLTRYGIRQLCRQRLVEENINDIEKADLRFRRMLEQLRQSPIAIETAAANEQHYEIPTRFFQLCLGKRLKYSSCFYKTGDETLDEAEVAMLGIYSERAELKDGQHILELGCGWGSLTLWMAEKYPNANITAVSNSATQRLHIEAVCRERGWQHVKVITCDVNTLELDANQFDRVVSVEMFEHMRNYQTLLNRISKWMKPEAKLFVHIFCHRYVMYPFETDGDDNWMGKYFFTGGIMPSADTLLHFQQDMSIQQRWLVSGEHYEKTSNHWLANQDANREEIMQIMKSTYGEKDAKRWFNRWRMFWLSCAELFGLEDGNEWLVAHYLFCKR